MKTSGPAFPPARNRRQLDHLPLALPHLDPGRPRHRPAPHRRGQPRSVAFQLARLAEHLDALPQRDTGARRPYEARLILSALTAVRLAQIEDLVRYESTAGGPTSKRSSNQLTAALPALSDALTQGYLSHAAPTRQLSTNRRSRRHDLSRQTRNDVPL